MGVRCSCYESLAIQERYAREDARRRNAELGARLDAFREGIMSGGLEVAARHLYMAGVYQASLMNGFTASPGVELVLRMVQGLAMGERLRGFYVDNFDLVRRQADYVDPEAVLKGMVSRRRGLEGRLAARREQELEDAEEALRQLEKLQESLKTWREGLRLESRVQLQAIYDKHIYF